MEMEHIGRLVVVAERHLTDESRGALKGLLARLVQHQEVTFVAGFGRAACLEAAAEGGELFYNRAEPMPLWQVAGLMPWREVWMVAGGRIWGMCEMGGESSGARCRFGAESVPNWCRIKAGLGPIYARKRNVVPRREG